MTNLTPEQFSKLSPNEQEEFINSGGRITETSLSSDAEVLSSPSVTEGQTLPETSSSIPACSLSGNGNQSEVRSSLSLPSSLGDASFLGIDIKNPLELLFLIDEDISSGRVKLYDWQIKILLDFASKDGTESNPIQAVVRACNGSGKDKYVIAPCCVWLAMRFKETICVVTSASGTQLDNQTCRYIKGLCEKFNKKFNVKFWDCVYRKYTLDFGDGFQSYIFAYATDEPKKAEGYHPTTFNAKMGIFVSEDKTVPDDINVALNKCTGYTHRFHVSTPGLPMGHFYDYCSTAIKRKDIESLNDALPTDWVEYHIKASECGAHISTSYLKQMERDLPGGKFGAAYKSQVEAEFATTDEMVVIPYTYIWRAVNSKIDWITESYNKAGLDLSDGGDETVLCVRNGNKLIAVETCRFEDTEDTIIWLKEKFKEHNLNSINALVYTDCGGMGKPMIDRLRREGWKNMKYVDNRSKALYPLTYLNRGAELFFNMRKLLECNELILIKDDKLMRQLSTRYYKLRDGRVHQLLSKVEQKSKGYPSPDRADACNLAFWDYRWTFKTVEETDKDKLPFELAESKKKPVGSLDMRASANSHNKPKYFGAEDYGKDFSFLQEEIDNHNKRIITK